MKQASRKAVRASHVPGFCRRLGFLAVSASCLVLVGCSDLHLYRQSSLDLANKALTAFADAKLTESVNDERKISDALTQQEQALARRNTLARRDAELIEIFGQTDAATSWGLLTNKIANRLQDIMSPAGVVQYWNDIKGLTDEVKFRTELYQSKKKATDPDIPATAKNAATKGVPQAFSDRDLGDLYTNILLSLSQLDDASTRFNAAALATTNGLLPKLAHDIAEAEAAKKDLQTLLSGRKKDLQTAKTNYDQAVRGGQSLKAVAAELAKKLDALDLKDATNVLAKLDKAGLGGLGMEGTLARLSEEQAALNGIVGFLADQTNSSGKVISIPTNSNRLVVELLPAFKNAAKELETPRVGHLLLAQQLANVLVEEANRNITRAEARLQMLTRKRAFLLREVVSLDTARRRAEEALTNAPADKILSAWIAGLPPTQSRAAEEALVDYAISWSVGRVQQEEIDYGLIGLSLDAALDGTETALMQWQNLIGIPLQQLVAYYGTGIKPETVAELISAAAIATTIGVK